MISEDLTPKRKSIMQTATHQSAIAKLTNVKRASLKKTPKKSLLNLLKSLPLKIVV